MNYRNEIQTNLLLIFLLFASMKSYTQITETKDKSLPEPYEVIDRIIPPSPESSGLGKYGSWTVSYQSGTPQIEIPLWDLSDEHLNLHISISYHASGVKLDDYSGRAGQNWTLNAGGAVVRSVAGNNDELNGSNRQGLFHSPESTLLNAFNTVVTNHNYNYNDFSILKRWGAGEYDLEPDLFFFNFASASGSFVFDKNRNLSFLNGSDVRILEHPFLSASTNNRFVLTGEDGIIYIFDATEITHTRTYVHGQYESENTFVSSWYISKIIYPTHSTNIDDTQNEMIDFFYDDFIQEYNGILSDSKSKTIEGSGSGQTSYDRSSFNETTVYSKVLREINSRNVRLTFNNPVDGILPEGSTSLEEITVTDKIKNKIIKRYFFTYSYNDVGDRRFLYSVEEYDNTMNAQKLYYSFEYYNFEDVPEVNSKSQDFWGYFSNKSCGSCYSFCPTVKYGVHTLTGIDRRPDNVGVLYGTLKRIIFPTGGYSDFIFESNTFDNTYTTPDNININTGGGIRIKEIINSDGTNQVKKTYSYFNGKLISVPTFVHQTKTIGSSSYKIQLQVNAKNMASLGTSSGSYVIYKKVEEAETSSNGTNGKTIFFYPEINFDNNDAYYPFAPKMHTYDHLFGKDDSSAVYTSASIQKQSTLKSYEHIAIAGFPGKKLGMALSVVGGIPQSDDFNFIKKSDYFYDSYWTRQTSEIVKTRGDDNKIVTYHAQFTYLEGSNPAHHQLKSKIIIQSNGRSKTISYKYPTEYATYARGDIMNNALKQFKERNITNLPVEMLLKENNDVVNAQIIIFKPNTGNTINYLPYQTWGYFLPQTSTSFTESFINSSGQFVKDGAYQNLLLQIDKYDNYENILQFQKNDKITVSVVYGYNNSKAIALIQGKSHDQIPASVIADIQALENESLSAAEIKTINKNIRIALPGTLISTYRYYPLIGTATETDPSGKTIHFKYDNFNRLQFIKDIDTNILKKIDYHYANETK